MNNNKTFTRRNFTALGAAAALGLATEAKAEREVPQAKIAYKPAIPSKVADYAYELYADGGCMFAAVKSVLSLTSSGADPIYYDMFRYGHGGCGGQGSLCGACNGIAASIGFYVQDKQECSTLIAEVFRWYETAELPVYKPADSDSDCVTSASGSILCHVSMTKWCKASGKSPFSAERKNRCARLTADTVAKTVKVLNDYFFDSNKSNKKVSSIKQSSCVPCHTKDIKSGRLSKSPKVKVKMDCTTCHLDVHPDKK